MWFQVKDGKITATLEERPMMITSVRRSINTLTKLGYLEKTKERRRSGPANEMNYCWKLSR